MATAPDLFPDSERFVTDAGLETWLVFHRGVDLPAFAAYPLSATDEGRRLLVEYYEHYLAIATDHAMSVVLETPTWRANPDWATTLGHDREALGALIDLGVALVADLRARSSATASFLVSGTVGPRGDGYRIESQMTVDDAAEYHGFQIERMVAAGAQLVTAITMGYVEEAAGIVLAAHRAGVPAVVSFTVETDGTLPSNMSLADAIDRTDALAGGGPLHYMVNCAHPTHFAHVLVPGDPWASRIGGIRANASTLSHADLDEMTVLDDGDPADLARRYMALDDLLPNLRVVGGCCGTDERHVAAIARAWAART